MHYFKFNIGDYHKKAGRLSMLQHGAYTLLIHACYDREKFPTEEEAIDWCWASSPEEVAAVKFVLTKFFTLEDDRYVQARIEQEIVAYHERSETNRAIAIKREASKLTKRDDKSTNRAEDDTNRERSVQGRAPNHKPITKNQETKKILERPEGLSEDVWSDFLAFRKSIKAPLTQTAVKMIQSQAEQAGWTIEQALTESMTRGWRGFKAEWVKNKSQSNDQSSMFAGGI